MDRVLRQKRRRTTAALYVQSSRLEKLIGPLPAENEVIKIVSLANLSAAGFLRYVADQTTIRELTVSTYRVGPNTLRQLRRLRELGHLDRATFIVGRLMSKDKRKASAIQYWEDLSDLCQRHGWACVSLDNHTKLALCLIRTLGNSCWREAAISTRPPTMSSSAFPVTRNCTIFTPTPFVRCGRRGNRRRGRKAVLLNDRAGS